MILYIAKSGKFTSYNKDGKVKRHWNQQPICEDTEELFMANSLEVLIEMIATYYELDSDDLLKMVTIHKTESIGEVNVVFKYYEGDYGNFAPDDADEEYINDPNTSLAELEFLIQKCEQVEVTDKDFAGYKQK